VFEYAGTRCYGVCCAEKGVFRFTITTDGVAGHASMPGMGENALLKMARSWTGSRRASPHTASPTSRARSWPASERIRRIPQRR